MSLRTNRYLSRSQHPSSKKSKTEKSTTGNSRGKGKKSQAVAVEDVMLPPLTATPTPPKAFAPFSQPPELGETSVDQSSRVRTNLIRLGADVPPGASIINSSLDVVEYASRIAPPVDVGYLAAMDVNLMQERYLRHIFEAMLEGQVIHVQRLRVTDALVEDIKGLSADNKSLKDLMSAPEGALNNMEGELGVLRKEHETLTVAMRKEQEALKEQEDHEKTRSAHAVALREAEEVYKRSTKYKEDVMNYMSNPEAVREIFKT